MKVFNRMKIAASLAMAAFIFLTGCAATQTALSKKDLDVETKTSTAIFVDPVPASKRTVYLDVKSGVMEFDRRQFKQFVAEQFTQANDHGYQIVDDPDKAHFQMVVYVLNLEKTNPSASEAALGKGYMGGAVLGGAALGGIGNSSHPMNGAVAGGLLAGATELVGGALVHDVYYMLVADVQIKERTASGVVVRKDSRVNAKISDSGDSNQTVSEATDMKEYRTRVVTTANQANMDLDKAKDVMFKKTAYALAGFF